jgi:hypothetical protein
MQQKYKYTERTMMTRKGHKHDRYQSMEKISGAGSERLKHIDIGVYSAYP